MGRGKSYGRGRHNPYAPRRDEGQHDHGRRAAWSESPGSTPRQQARWAAPALPAVDRRPNQARPCRFCGQAFTDVARHIERNHTPKYFGLKCPICSHFENLFDRSNFKRHLNRHQLACEQLEVYVVAVPGGFLSPRACSFCTFAAPSIPELQAHFDQFHKVEDLSVDTTPPQVAELPRVVRFQPPEIEVYSTKNQSGFFPPTTENTSITPGIHAYQPSQARFMPTFKPVAVIPTVKIEDEENEVGLQSMQACLNNDGCATVMFMEGEEDSETGLAINMEAISLADGHTAHVIKPPSGYAIPLYENISD